LSAKPPQTTLGSRSGELWRPTGPAAAEDAAAAALDTAELAATLAIAELAATLALAAELPFATLGWFPLPPNLWGLGRAAAEAIRAPRTKIVEAFIFASECG